MSHNFVKVCSKTITKEDKTKFVSYYAILMDKNEKGELVEVIKKGTESTAKPLPQSFSVRFPNDVKSSFVNQQFPFIAELDAEGVTNGKNDCFIVDDTRVDGTPRLYKDGTQVLCLVIRKAVSITPCPRDSIDFSHFLD